MRRMHVLVVDDSAVMRRALARELFKDPDIEAVDTAPNGRIALAKIALNPPDLITLDIEMPEMGGMETLAKLRKSNPLLPVIMFSVHGKPDTSLAPGAPAGPRVDYVAKPSGVLGWDSALKVIREILLPK